MLQQEPKREVSRIIYALFAVWFAFSLVIAILNWTRFVPLWISAVIYGGGILVSLWYLLGNGKGRTESR
jgi:hypothetical protein